MEEAGMVQFWFEIFRQAYDRWSWHFVEVSGGQRRVLARSGRDYSSRKKARKAAYRFVETLQDAQIMPGTGGYRLPASRFDVDYGVVPLMAGVSRRGGKPRRRDRRERVAVVAAAEPAQSQAAAAAGPSEPEQAAKAMRTAKEATPRPARGGRRRSKDT
jgi:hypothetical protein